MVEVKKDFQDSVLEVLSFYEEMSWERIIMDFEEDFLKEHADFNKETLENILLSLSKKKLINVRISENGEKLYKKPFPKKSLWRKIRECLRI